MTAVIDSFMGEYRFLSNFYVVPVRMSSSNFIYPSAEHAYQAAKARLQVDHDAILNATTPGNAKRLGRRVHIRDGWDKIRVTVMRDILQHKFQNEYLASKLILTGDAELIEGNHWGDHFWGVCNGTGENNLGKLLMQVREDIQ